ncbi:PEP-CTERM sorting domain-containing protein [Calidifontimicrobium sp. SYSU G02091]|uniref:PEP-CTERM sorting domain-containing protein n=1 Tax=Calidifontimicrobium sp. SYSU G02091 TaxID=2926421 RepID=UPI001F52F52D|nr:PEP-CTERM sorting domain-containing protein [Calidifontimicrobium sp. SYSU G02091]MCI1192188.1 PEP-CTERM sorting domain-containing protein [Calidifontimicrobium sp. SYSU G02091]
MRLHSLALAAALAAAAAPASALVLVQSQTVGATAVADFSAPGQLAFDVDFRNTAPVTLTFRVEADDLLAPLAFDAVLLAPGTGFDVLGFALHGASFQSIGSVTPQFGGRIDRIVVGSDFANVYFAAPEFLGVEVGDAFGPPSSKTDWTLSLAGLKVGDTFRITVATNAVPEPATLAMALTGLGLLGWSRRAGRATSTNA